MSDTDTLDFIDESTGDTITKTISKLKIKRGRFGDVIGFEKEWV